MPSSGSVIPKVVSNTATFFLPGTTTTSIPIRFAGLCKGPKSKHSRITFFTSSFNTVKRLEPWSTHDVRCCTDFINGLNHTIFSVNASNTSFTATEWSEDLFLPHNLLFPGTHALIWNREYRFFRKVPWPYGLLPYQSADTSKKMITRQLITKIFRGSSQWLVIIVKVGTALQ